VLPAVSNRRLVAADNTSIAFRCKDYRINGPGRSKTMRLHPHEFIRRFLMHVLPKGFHRIRQNTQYFKALRGDDAIYPQIYPRTFLRCGWIFLATRSAHA
jgi:hypothetical protein